MWVYDLHCLPFCCCRCINGTVKIPLCTVTYRLSPVGLAGLVSSWGVFVIQWTYSSVIQVVWRRRRQLKLSATLISWQLYWSSLKFFITKVGLSRWKLLRQVYTSCDLSYAIRFSKNCQRLQICGVLWLLLHVADGNLHFAGEKLLLLIYGFFCANLKNKTSEQRCQQKRKKTNKRQTSSKWWKCFDNVRV